MDSEELRRIRREKILKRSGIKIEEEEEKKEIVTQSNELSAREQLEMIESIEQYKHKVKNIKIGVIVLIGIFAGYYAAKKNKYLILACFVSAIVPYKFITELSYGIITPDLPLSSLEKAARKFKIFKEFFSDILLFLCAVTLAISAWANILS